MTTWHDIELEQQAVCKRFNEPWTPVDPINTMVSINHSLFTDIQPLNGLRHPRENHIDGWYLWSGGDIPQDQIDFFKPIHAIHLVETCPIILKYLGLPHGYRFLISVNGYEDVWFDETILDV